MKIIELTDLKTTINWLLENGDFKDTETAYNIAMNSVDILEKQLSIPRVSGSCPIEAIMHYDKLIKTKLERTFEPLRDHGTHADFCDKINDLREEAKSNYR